MSVRSSPDPAAVGLESRELAGTGQQGARVLGTADTRRFDRSLVQGMFWTGSVKWASQVLTWITTIVVARLLTPADYGLVAMAATFTNLVAVINEFGVGITVMSLRHLDTARLAQLNTFAVGLGVLGLGLSCAAAVPLAHFYQAPELVLLLSVMGIGFVISSARSVPEALLQKELRWKLIAWVEGVRMLIQAVATVALASLGFGYWALALGSLVGASAWTALILSIRPQRFAWPDPRGLREAMAFSSYVVVSRLSWYAQAASDSMIIGRVLGPAALGSYGMAFSLAMVPVEKVAAVVSQVTTSLFAAVQDNAAAARRYMLALTEGFALIGFPATLGIALVADEFVLLALGPKWASVVEPLRILAFYAAFRSVQSLPAQIVFVNGGARLAMVNSLATAGLLPLVFYVRTWWGTAGVAAAWLVVHPLASIPINARAFRVLGLSLRDYLRVLWPAFSGSLVMMVAVLLLRRALPIDLPRALYLGLLVAGAAAVYSAFLVLFHRPRLAAFVRIISQRDR